MTEKEKEEASYRCVCGACFSAQAVRGQTVSCPYCGMIVVLGTRSSPTQKDFEELIEAAAEVLAEGNPPISGAR